MEEELLRRDLGVARSSASRATGPSDLSPASGSSRSSVPNAVPFTPGPWAIDGFSLVVAPNPKDGQYRVVADCRSNAPANARLIAAAPDLYEALREVVRKFDAAPSAVRNIPLGIMKARAALAKASCDRSPKGGDAASGSVEDESAVGEAETPTPSDIIPERKGEGE